MDKVNKNRIWEIDFLRGLAVIGMIVFHIFYILNFFNVVQNEMYKGGFLVLAKFVQYTFLGLVGVSLVLSKSGHKKIFLHGLKIFLFGIIISLVTYIFVPNVYVKFGILHLIGLSIIILIPLIHRKYISLFCGFIALLVGLLIEDITSTNYIFYYIGFRVENLNSIDYFPVFPWISVVLFGIFIGNILREMIIKYEIKFLPAPKMLNPIIILGQKSLLIYMGHVPAIIIILMILNIVPIDKILSF